MQHPNQYPGGAPMYPPQPGMPQGGYPQYVPGGPVPPGYKVSKKGQLKPLNKDKKNKVGKKNKGSPHAMSPPMTGPGGMQQQIPPGYKLSKKGELKPDKKAKKHGSPGLAHGGPGVAMGHPYPQGMPGQYPQGMPPQGMYPQPGMTAQMPPMQGMPMQPMPGQYPQGMPPQQGMPSYGGMPPPNFNQGPPPPQ